MKRERATATEPMEPIRPSVRRVIVAMPDRACAEDVLPYLEDPYIRSLYGEPVEP